MYASIIAYYLRTSNLILIPDWYGRMGTEASRRTCTGNYGMSATESFERGEGWGSSVRCEQVFVIT